MYNRPIWPQYWDLYEPRGPANKKNLLTPSDCHYIARMGEKRNAYSILVEKPEGKGSLGRPRHRWEYHIQVDLRDIGWWGMDRIDLAQDRSQWMALVNTVMNLRVP
jgi:hypothetical protein